MNMKTLLLYAALGCGGLGALAYNFLPSHVEEEKAIQEVEEPGNVQHKGPAPIRTAPQGF